MKSYSNGQNCSRRIVGLKLGAVNVAKDFYLKMILLNALKAILSIILENFKCLSLPILEKRSGQNDLSKITIIFKTGSDVIKTKKIKFYHKVSCVKIS